MMNDVVLIIAIVLYVLFFVLMVYLCIIADPAKNRYAKFLLVDMPQRALDLVQRITPRSVTRASDTLSRKIFYEPNPLMQVLYLFIVLGSWSIVFFHAYPLVPNGYVSSHHKIAGYLVFVLCMGSWRMACRTSPGYVTERNMPKFDNYPYDDLLYSNRICPTANIRKIPRSKYDRMTKRHVARFDHYCAWLKNPVGEENYRLFLAFLAVHVAMCWYGSVVVFLIFRNEVDEKDLWNATFMDVATGQKVDADIMIICHFIFVRHTALAGAWLMMSVMGLVLTGFFAFHLFLVSRGMTTNEHYKWQQVRRYHRKSKKAYEKAKKEGKAGPPRDKSSLRLVSKIAPPLPGGKEEVKGGNGGTVGDGGERRDDTTAGDGEGKGTSAEAATATAAAAPAGRDENGDGAGASILPEGGLPEMDVGCTGATPVTGGEDGGDGNDGDGKERSGREDGPTKDDRDDAGEGLVKDPGPMPRHLYNLGLVENFREVLFPRSLRPRGQRRWEGKGGVWVGVGVDPSATESSVKKNGTASAAATVKEKTQ